MENKKIINYNGGDQFVITIPVYYECENKPAWRKVFKGTFDECKNNFDSFPDYLHATYEENKQNIEWKRREYMFLLSINKIKKAMEMKKQYNL